MSLVRLALLKARRLAQTVLGPTASGNPNALLSGLYYFGVPLKPGGFLGLPGSSPMALFNASNDCAFLKTSLDQLNNQIVCERWCLFPFCRRISFRRRPNNADRGGAG